VQVIPHITNEIIECIQKLDSPDTDVVISEIGGIVGDIENQPFLEAIRQFGQKMGREDVLYIHLTLVPYLSAAEEIKTKPTQHSVGMLRQAGIQPDIIICRTEKHLGSDVKEKLSLFCNVDKNAIIDVVDISESSINLAKNLINNDRINFTLANIFDFNSNKKYDFITMGEVLEHVENPLSLLLKLNELLNKNGTLYITAPTNAPTIDHIYLFKNINEIKSLLNKAGFKIEKDIYFYAEDLPEEMAEKMEIALMYGAFLKKI